MQEGDEQEKGNNKRKELSTRKRKPSSQPKKEKRSFN